MAKGVYLIDPDGKSGMLEDGTEFVSAPASEGEDACAGCIARGLNICIDFGECFSYDFGKRKVTDSWIFVRKE